MEMTCVCDGWKENYPKIRNITMSAHIHGVEYDGDTFMYCPWCGEDLHLQVPDVSPTALASEKVLAKHWSTPEEDEAWKDL